MAPAGRLVQIARSHRATRRIQQEALAQAYHMRCRITNFSLSLLRLGSVCYHLLYTPATPHSFNSYTVHAIIPAPVYTIHIRQSFQTHYT